MAKWEIKTPADYKKAEDAIQAKLEKLGAALKEAPADTLYQELCATMDKAISRAPIEEGHLRRAGRVEINGVTYAQGQAEGKLHRYASNAPEMPAGSLDYAIGFWADAGDHGAGDVNTYAWVQHEHTEFQHPKGGEAKFLESAIREDQGRWQQAIARAAREAIDDL